MKFAEKISAACLLAAGVIAAFSLGACSKEPEDNTKDEPFVFPDAQTFTVQANTIQTLTFTVNDSWTLTSDAGWATFDGELSCSGEAGDNSVDLTVSDLDQSLEETTTAKLTMTHDGDSEVICIIYRLPEGTEFSVTDAEGNEVNALTAGWDDYDYYTITANFEFAVTSQPEWLVTESAVTGSDGNPCTAGFKVVDDSSIYKYTQSGEITFANESGSISFVYVVNYAGMGDGIDIEGAGRWNWTANADGTIISHDGTETEPTFTISVQDDDYVIVNADYTDPTAWAFYVDEAYDSEKTHQDEAAAWIHVTADDGKGTVTLSVDATTAARTAFVFAFPRSIYEKLGADSFAALYDEDGDFNESEYEEYVVAAIEQTLASGDEKFAVKNGQTEDDVEVETDCPEGYDFSSVLSQYPDAYVGYVKGTVGVNYITTVLPLSENGEWICNAAAYDANGDTCSSQSYYYDCEPGSDYYSGGVNYYSYSVCVTHTPTVSYIYVVYTNDDEKWVLFFYDLDEYYTAEFYLENADTHEQLDYETEYSGVYDLSEIIAHYSPETVAYLRYEVGTSYNVTFHNVAEDDTWPTRCEAYYYDNSIFTGYSSSTTTVDGIDGIACVKVSLTSDPGELFYFVFHHESENCLFFFYNDTVPEKEESGFYITADGEKVDYETSYDGEYDFSEILEHYYPQSAVGYIKYEVGTQYNITLTPLSIVGDWVQAPLAKDLDGNELSELTAYYDVEYGSISIDGRSYSSCTLKVLQDPHNSFFLAFTDSNESTNTTVYYILCFYTDDAPGSAVEYNDFKVKNNSTYVTSTASAADPGYYTTAMNEVLSQYNPALVGYYEYTVGASYSVTIEPYSTDNTFISSSYKVIDASGNDCTTLTSYYTISSGNTFYYNPSYYPAVDIKVSQKTGTDFFYLVCTDSYGNDCILFFYTEPEEEEDLDQTVYTGFLVEDADTKTAVTVSTSYSGEYSSAISSVISKYGASNVGYVELVGELAYYIQPTPAQKNASQVWDAGLFDLDGNDLSTDTGTFKILKNMNIYSDGFSYPVYDLTVNTDPGKPFYVVFDEGYANKSILFVTSVDFGFDEGGTYDETAAFVVQNQTTHAYYTVGSADEWAGATSYSKYGTLATTLAGQYDEVAYVIYGGSGIFYVTVASLPLDEASGWSVSEFTDADGEPASYSDFGYSSTTFEDYPAFSVKVNQSAGFPAYLVLTNSSDNSTKALILSDK
ncbi:MAG: DUF5003 domain-containing protein [Porphyromonadaceae bacterium]|nr:DUF5003 domain-containing protein [Porphyromonadaceae bacterium]